MPGSGVVGGSLFPEAGATAARAGGPQCPVISNVDVTVNGTPLGLAGAIEDGVALAAVDTLVPALGGALVRTFATPGVRIFLGGNVLTASADIADIRVNGRPVAAAIPPVLVDGHLYLPVQPLAEAAGYAVNWPTATGGIAVNAGPSVRTRLSSPAAAADAAPAPVSTGPPPLPVAPVPPPIIPYTAEDLNLIARVVHGEAGGQPALAKVGVAAVIVNRVRDPGWPKTIPGVIYAPGQFQAVGYPLFERQPSPVDIEAALQALRGEDPTDGAVYFYNPAQTWRGSWIFTRKTLVTIGAFRFAQ